MAESKSLVIFNALIQSSIMLLTLWTACETRNQVLRATDQMLLSDVQNRVTFANDILRRDQSIMLERFQSLWNEQRKLQTRILKIATKSSPLTEAEKDDLLSDLVDFQEKWNATLRIMTLDKPQKINPIAQIESLINTGQYKAAQQYMESTLQHQMTDHLNSIDKIIQSDVETYQKARFDYDRQKTNIEKLPASN